MVRGIFAFLFFVVLPCEGMASADPWDLLEGMQHDTMLNQDVREGIRVPLPANWHVVTLSENEIVLQPQDGEAHSNESRMIRVTAFKGKNSVFEALIKFADQYMSSVCPCASTVLSYDVTMRTHELGAMQIVRFSCANSNWLLQSFVRHIPGKEVDFIVSYQLHSTLSFLPLQPLAYREWLGIITTLRAAKICESESKANFCVEEYEWWVPKSEAKVAQVSQEVEGLRALIGD